MPPLIGLRVWRENQRMRDEQLSVGFLLKAIRVYIYSVGFPNTSPRGDTMNEATNFVCCFLFVCFFIPNFFAKTRSKGVQYSSDLTSNGALFSNDPFPLEELTCSYFTCRRNIILVALFPLYNHIVRLVVILVLLFPESGG